jgi:hypothetical protein
MRCFQCIGFYYSQGPGWYKCNASRTAASSRASASRTPARGVPTFNVRVYFYCLWRILFFIDYIAHIPLILSDTLLMSFRYRIVGEIVVHVRPPSVVLSRDDGMDGAELIAHPVVLETKSRREICLKLSFGVSFIQ